ncbi:MAG: hypothetical protein JWR37_4635 [Mycobacterium sp.]|nr:hypothetical protein [Mycobacterium sp.]
MSRLRVVHARIVGLVGRVILGVVGPVNGIVACARRVARSTGGFGVGICRSLRWRAMTAGRTGCGRNTRVLGRDPSGHQDRRPNRVDVALRVSARPAQ